MTQTQKNQIQKDTTHSGYYTRSEIKKVARPARPRDDLKKAFAGKENNGPSRKSKSSKQSTNLKSRVRKKFR